MKSRLNQFIKAAILCLNTDHLIMILADGTRFEGKVLGDVPDLDRQPVLLVINPAQFLTAKNKLRHLYLTTWQQEILHQLKELPYVLRSVMFLPDLVGDRKGLERSFLVDFREQRYLYVSKEGVVLWTHLVEGENQAQQLQEIGLYLRRYQIAPDMNQVAENLVSYPLTDREWCLKAGERSTFNLQNNSFPLIQQIVEKQYESKFYTRLVSGLLCLMGGGLIAGLYFLWLGYQAFVDHNPWNLDHSIQSLEEGERKKLLQFKDYLAFQSKYPAFSLVDLAGLFHRFAGKIVATDIAWQEGKWTMAFVINPAFAAEFPQVSQWCTENLQASQLIESESTAHQYILRFKQRLDRGNREG